MSNETDKGQGCLAQSHIVVPVQGFVSAPDCDNVALFDCHFRHLGAYREELACRACLLSICTPPCQAFAAWSYHWRLLVFVARDLRITPAQSTSTRARRGRLRRCQLTASRCVALQQTPLCSIWARAWKRMGAKRRGQKQPSVSQPAPTSSPQRVGSGPPQQGASTQMLGKHAFWHGGFDHLATCSDHINADEYNNICQRRAMLHMERVQRGMPRQIKVYIFFPLATYTSNGRPRQVQCIRVIKGV